MHRSTDPPAPRRGARTRQTLVLAAVLLLGLSIGVGAAAALRGEAPPPAEAASASGSTRDGDPEALAELPDPDPLIDPAEAEDPETALRGFLAAEARGEWDTSYAFLTDALREVTYTSPAAWTRAHADAPRVLAYRIDDVAVDEDAGRARLQTLTGFDPVVDPVLGLVAARGRTDWVVERDDAGLWRVNATETQNRPLHPSSEGAEATARRWVDRRVACEDTAALEAGLVGTRVLADRLCGEDQPAQVPVGAVSSLADSADASALLSQFGPEVFSWARTVRVEAATPLTLVLGPVGAEWRVVAVIGAA